MRKPCKNCGSRHVGVVSVWERSVLTATAIAACRNCGAHTETHRVPVGEWVDEPIDADELKKLRRRAVSEAFRAASTSWESGEVRDA